MSVIFENHLKTLEQTTERKQAVIREDDCIGCTKCLPACPVDAIIGGAKQMHSIVSFDCTGCQLCLEPCPVDCIDMVTLPAVTPAMQTTQLQHFHHRYQKNQQRLQPEKTKTARTPDFLTVDKKSYITAALQRVKNKIRK